MRRAAPLRAPYAGLAAAAALLATTSLPARAATPAPVPVLFVPWQLPAELQPHEELLRTSLAARLLARGRVVEAVSGQTEEVLQQCVRSVNREANQESCWIRIGQGQGATEMVAGRVVGGPHSCTLTVRRTQLERRVAVGIHVAVLEPCDRDGLLAALQPAAEAVDPAPARPQAGAVGAKPPPLPPGIVGTTPTDETPKDTAELPLRVELWKDSGRRGERLQRSGVGGGKLERQLRGRVSSVQVHGAGWVVLYSNDDNRGARLVVPGGVRLDDLRRIPKVNSALRNPLLPESDWDDEAEACELFAPDRPPEGLEEGRVTVIEEQGRGYRMQNGRRRAFTF